LRVAVHNAERNRNGDFYADLVADVFREVSRNLKPGRAAGIQLPSRRRARLALASTVALARAQVRAAPRMPDVRRPRADRGNEAAE
jgi:hypothetical protein